MRLGQWGQRIEDWPGPASCVPTLAECNARQAWFILWWTVRTACPGRGCSAASFRKFQLRGRCSFITTVGPGRLRGPAKQWWGSKILKCISWLIFLCNCRECFADNGTKATFEMRKNTRWMHFYQKLMMTLSEFFWSKILCHCTLFKKRKIETEDWVGSAFSLYTMSPKGFPSENSQFI